MSVANGVAVAVVVWAIIYALFAYLPWQMAVLILVTTLAALVVLLRPPRVPPSRST
jgi:hypothetical protein